MIAYINRPSQTIHDLREARHALNSESTTVLEQQSNLSRPQGLV